MLGEYGYKTAAFGKWHNTPATETTAMGPFTLWPTGEGIGFDYFYGFLAGETSQWEPRLVENFNAIEPPHDETYHLTEDMAEKAIAWMRRHRAFAPDKPFFMYWAPGGGTRAAPRRQGLGGQVQGSSSTTAGIALRERAFERQKALGWIPAEHRSSRRAPSPWPPGTASRRRSAPSSGA
ncbi:MAG: sulfatase-like hydrolase/transferase [Dermatophilaceae bacterium]